MDDSFMRRKAAEARVARVGTVDEQGRVHLVPVTFALDGNTWYSPSDAGARPVKRLRNLRHDPRVTILIDAYDEDWSRVWWVRLRGRGRMIEASPEHGRAQGLLTAKYTQFGDTPSEEGAGPVMAVDIEEWSGWAMSG